MKTYKNIEKYNTSCNARVYALCLSKDQKWRRVMLHYV